jgi:hypothetical protein
MFFLNESKFLSIIWRYLKMLAELSTKNPQSAGKADQRHSLV